MDEAVEVLGRLTAEPMAALEEIAAKPHALSGALVMGLACFGNTLAGPLPGSGAEEFLKAVGRGFGRGLLSWVGVAAVVHAVSALFSRRGNWMSFLAVTGWAGVLRWGELPIRMAGGGAILAAPRLGLGLLLVLVWWWALRRVYGWSRGGAFLMLGVCALGLGLMSGVVALAGKLLPAPVPFLN